MKLNKQQLKTIIKEEISILIKEGGLGGEQPPPNLQEVAHELYKIVLELSSADPYTNIESLQQRAEAAVNKARGYTPDESF
jgi:hypothetical protein